MCISIVFTGHMIDLPGRATPRFPAALEVTVRRAIATRIKSFASGKRPLVGFASGARGGDILFHEECRRQGIRSHMVLPFAPDLFVKTSVQGIPGSDWAERFWTLRRNTPTEDREVMHLAQTDEAYSMCNTRIIELARQHGTFHLIALWDGGGGDGPGGTADMVTKARAQGDEPDIIDPAKLLR